MTDTRRISIAEALVELKLYDSKINKAIANGCLLIDAKKKSSDIVGVQSVEDFNKSARADYQSITDLIKNRAKLKSAIVQSNAVTQVQIAGVTYTVAEAIERKNSIEYDIDLLNHMKAQYAAATNKVLTENKRVDNQVDKMLETYLGKDSEKKINESDIKVITDPYRQQNEYELVDPLDLRKTIEELESAINAFEADCDVCLSISNATTFIEV